MEHWTTSSLSRELEQCDRCQVSLVFFWASSVKGEGLPEFLGPVSPTAFLMNRREGGRDNLGNARKNPSQYYLTQVNLVRTPPQASTLQCNGGVGATCCQGSAVNSRYMHYIPLYWSLTGPFRGRKQNQTVLASKTGWNKLNSISYLKN